MTITISHFHPNLFQDPALRVGSQPCHKYHTRVEIVVVKRFRAPSQMDALFRLCLFTFSNFTTFDEIIIFRHTGSIPSDRIPTDWTLDNSIPRHWIQTRYENGRIIINNKKEKISILWNRSLGFLISDRSPNDRFCKIGIFHFLLLIMIRSFLCLVGIQSLGIRLSRYQAVGFFVTRYSETLS